MNYLAHARTALDDPWFVAGTSLPDWSAIADSRRKLRRPDDLRPAMPDEPPSLVALRSGVLRHFDDDAAFHDQSTFNDLSAWATIQLRSRVAAIGAAPVRASFFGHVAVEMLLDSAIETAAPGSIDRYYRALSRVTSNELTTTLRALSHVIDATSIGRVFERFRSARFLEGYVEDSKLCDRLDGVTRRIGLPPTPREPLQSVVEDLRPRVLEAREQLLTL